MKVTFENVVFVIPIFNFNFWLLSCMQMETSLAYCITHGDISDHCYVSLNFSNYQTEEPKKFINIIIFIIKY